jgi:hypothetical protein
MPDGMEQATCAHCGAAVRENTTFCYNCGKRLAPESDVVPSVEIDAANDADLNDESDKAFPPSAAEIKPEKPLSESIKVPKAEEEGISRAAEERKKARTKKRKVKEYRWQPESGRNELWLLIASVVILALAVVIVLMTVGVR